MRKHKARRTATGLLICGLLSLVPCVRSQVVRPLDSRYQPNGYATPIPSAATSPYAIPYANPFMSPMFNPYLNPYMSSTSIAPDAALLYILAAQRASGGIGSGVPSGVRPPQGAAPPRPVARMPRSGDSLSEGAARYYGRGTTNVERGTGRYFDRYPGRFDR